MFPVPYHRRVSSSGCYVPATGHGMMEHAEGGDVAINLSKNPRSADTPPNGHRSPDTPQHLDTTPHHLDTQFNTISLTSLKSTPKYTLPSISFPKELKPPSPKNKNVSLSAKRPLLNSTTYKY
ncbi:hypothetical protein JTE90_001253 [Oedothorax gibbosus]|uniref:Uncharacterized protein n=1 Tax=Oedothorax gibbosus TaxID=931172 RepID=A0AAV6VSY6_9ARAC|nr:hypothetical protein JTE90_001253 [Oedothorax gibbosus]